MENNKIQNKVKVYWIANNPTALELKSKLNERKIQFEEHDVSLSAADAIEMIKRTGQNSNPLIVYEDKQWVIGGQLSFESVLNQLKN